MKTVVIDAGHGGHDPGAVGLHSCEKDHALAIALLVQKHLGDAVKTVLTRSTDVFVELTQRSVISNNAHADAFVSIHMNSATANTATGTETLYMERQDRDLADVVHPLLVQATGMRDRGIKYQNVSVVRKTNAPAILCEVGFISNPRDEQKLLDAAFRERVALAIAQGILKYLGVQELPFYQLFATDKHLMDKLPVINGTAYVEARKWGVWFKLPVGYENGKVLLSGKPIEKTRVIDSVGFIPIREAASAAGIGLVVDEKNKTITLKK